MTKRIAYQGILGSFSSVAARTLFGHSFTPIETTRFRDIFEHVKVGTADYGVLPVENALAGSVHENFDLLAEYSCCIVSELYCPVQLHIMGMPQADLSGIKQVISHPKALEQCSHFLETRGAQLQQLIFSDTAGAARHVRDLNDPSVAAIASEEAANCYELSILARSIQNHALNSTRFVAVAASETTVESPTKSSLIVSLAHQPGSLYALLGEIASLGVNLTKIESRPISGRPYEYAFHLDLEYENGQDNKLLECETRIRACTLSCRVLGRYKAASTKV